jgi:HEAT repeat protein
MHSKSDKKQPKTTVADHPESCRPFEWPLLIYPVLFLATLSILYVVNRSIQKESPLPSARPQAPQEQAVTPSRPGQADPVTHAVPGNRAKLGSGLASRSQESTAAAGANGNPPARPRNDRAGAKPGQSSFATGKMQRPIDPSQLQGANKIVAILRTAIAEKNEARIKQCIAELAAMGDAAVVPLNDLITHEEGDTALWAATALARIGTPTATSALLDRLSQTKEGTYKEELGKRVSSIRNHDSWPLLLDAMVQAGDTGVVRAATASLSMMADAPILDEVIARYDTATTNMEIERLAQLVRNIQSPKATESLLSLAGHVSSAPQDSLQQAAIEALGKVGDAQSVSYLLRRLEASPPGEGAQIFNTITQINSPQAQSSLLYAAAGNKEVSAEHGRTAAIYALKNYPDEKTVALLERIIAQEQNEKVLTAATRTLDDIKRSPHAVTASAGALQKSEETLPFKPLEK